MKLPGPKVKKKDEPRPEPAAPAGREVQVAEAAYYIAQERGFEPGRELDDWFTAENMIDAGACRAGKG